MMMMTTVRDSGMGLLPRCPRQGQQRSTGPKVLTPTHEWTCHLVPETPMRSWPHSQTIIPECNSTWQNVSQPGLKQ